MESLLQTRELSAEEFSYELEGEKPFTEEELCMLSNGMLSIIRNTNEAVMLISDDKSIKVLEDALKKYQELNKKVCEMM